MKSNQKPIKEVEPEYVEEHVYVAHAESDSANGSSSSTTTVTATTTSSNATNPIPVAVPSAPSIQEAEIIVDSKPVIGAVTRNNRNEVLVETRDEGVCRGCGITYTRDNVRYNDGNINYYYCESCRKRNNTIGAIFDSFCVIN